MLRTLRRPLPRADPAQPASGESSAKSRHRLIHQLGPLDAQIGSMAGRANRRQRSPLAGCGGILTGPRIESPGLSAAHADRNHRDRLAAAVADAQFELAGRRPRIAAADRDRASLPIWKLNGSWPTAARNVPPCVRSASRQIQQGSTMSTLKIARSPSSGASSSRRSTSLPVHCASSSSVRRRKDPASSVVVTVPPSGSSPANVAAFRRFPHVASNGPAYFADRRPPARCGPA